MNQTPSVERVLREYLSDDHGSAPDYVLDVVADRIYGTRQRRTWPLVRRLQMNTNLRLAAAAVIAAIAVGAIYLNLPGRNDVGGPSPSPSPSATQAQPSPTFYTGPLTGGPLTGGHYTITPAIEGLPGLKIAADIPAGWKGYPEVPALTSPSDSETAKVGGLIGFMPGERLFSDACHWNVDGSGSIDQPGDVEVGPAVDDLVAALQANTSYTSSDPSPVTIGGFQGTVLDLQLPGDDVLTTCDGQAGQTGDHKFIVLTRGFWSQGPDSRWRLFILDVGGTRLITMISSFGSLPQAELDAAQTIVESFEITP